MPSPYKNYNLNHNKLDFTHCSNCHFISEHARERTHAHALSLSVILHILTEVCQLLHITNTLNK